MTRYELLDRIGVGGMAEIFRGKAVAAGGFEKPVAIKRILPHLSQDPRFVELLIAEAKVLSLLKHRNIVQIFDVGLGDDNKYFLVMEYVDGKDLGAVQRGLESRRARVAFDLGLHVVAEICEALEHAHTARAPDGKPMALVHRDISPSNVLLSRAGEVKLTDFGIAKRAEQEHTGHGGVRGKFAYISPEQARNEAISPKSDVFAVGILLWELLANRRLFSGLDDLAALRAVREAPIQPPGELDPRVRDADAIVMAALSREPSRRPTAGQLGQQLRGLRYSLDDTSGDPATELAKVIETAEQVERQSRKMDANEVETLASRSQSLDTVDPGEMTVIRIRTADAFSERNDVSISMARSVIDRFEEEETRMAQLSGEQLKHLRRRNPQDSQELVTVTPPRPEGRSRRNTDEPTLFRQPVAAGPGTNDDDDGDGPEGPTVDAIEPPHLRYTPEENTRLVAPRDRRTPLPERPRSAPQQSRQPAASAAGRAQPERSGSRNAQPPRPGSATVPARGKRQTEDEDMIPVPGTLPIGGLVIQPGSPSQQQQQAFIATQLPPQPQYQQQQQQQQQQQHPGFLVTAPLPGYPPQPGYPPPPQPGYPPPPQYPTNYQPPPAPAGYPMYNPPGPPIGAERMQRAATPTSPDAFDRPAYPPQRQAPPPVSGFHPQGAPVSPLRPWMLVVGALVMAALAFALTRAFIH